MSRSVGLGTGIVRVFVMEVWAVQIHAMEEVAEPVATVLLDTKKLSMLCLRIG
jgi:hypothetical protein